MESSVQMGDHSVDSSTDRKREVHVRCEQQRRSAIKNGYSELRELISLSEGKSQVYCSKVTNSAILYRAADLIQKNQKQDVDQKEALKTLESQSMALQMICDNYERMICKNPPKDEWQASVDSLKFQIAKSILDHWFDSFTANLQTENYALLTHSILSWIESKIDFKDLPTLIMRSLELAQS